MELDLFKVKTLGWINILLLKDNWLVFCLATGLVTVYVFQEPSLLSSLQDNGLTDVVLHALLVKDVCFHLTDCYDEISHHGIQLCCILLVFLCCTFS